MPGRIIINIRPTIAIAPTEAPRQRGATMMAQQLPKS
jgi:hypothetical protein